MLDGGEEVGLGDRDAQHRHLQAREPDAHASPGSRLPSGCSGTAGATISIVARSTGDVAACLSACFLWCSSSSSAGVPIAGGAAVAAAAAPARRRATPVLRLGDRRVQPRRRRTPARVRGVRRNRAAAGRPDGSGGRARPRPGRCRAPGRRRGSSAAFPRRLRWARRLRPRSPTAGIRSGAGGTCRSACRSRRRGRSARGRGPPWFERRMKGRRSTSGRTWRCEQEAVGLVVRLFGEAATARRAPPTGAAARHRSRAARPATSW